MKHLILIVSTAVLLISSVVAQATGPSVEEITRAIQKRYDTIDNLTAAFTQHVKFGFSNIEQTFSGTLVMAKPNKYRIVSEQQTLVTDGTTVWAYSPVNHQVVIDKFKENRNSVSPDRFLLQLPDTYFVALLGSERDQEATLEVLKLVPKDDRSFLKSVKVWVDQSDWGIRKVQMLDLNDTETTYTLTNIRLNQPLQPDTFTFVPPKGTDVVDLR